MAYFSNLEKKINHEQKKPRIANTKIVAIALIVVATIGYFSLFTNLVWFLKHFLLGTFGIFAYAIFTALYVVGGMILKGKKYHVTTKYLVALVFALFSMLAIFHMAFSGGVDFSSYGKYLGEIYSMQVSVGGVLLGLLIYPLQKFLNFGAYILFLIVLVVCVTVIYNGIADAKSLSKIDFKFFRRKNKNNKALDEEAVEGHARNENIIKIETEQNIEEFNKDTSNESIGLGAEVAKEETARDIARRKLGLDRIAEGNIRLDNDDQLDTFKQNYMNTGGSVFSTKSFDRQDYSNTNYSGTFGYSTVLNTENRQKKVQEDEKKYNEYRKFMGLEPVTSLAQETQKTEPETPSSSIDIFRNDIFDTYSSSRDFYNKHDSTESSDERLFGAPKTEDTDMKFSYTAQSEDKSFMDRLSSDTNEEIKPKNLEDAEIKEENDLRAIFEKPVPKNDIELPKSFQNDSYSYTKKFDTSVKNPIDNEISRIQDYRKASETTTIPTDLPKQKIPKYHYTKPTLDLLNTASTDPSMYGGNVEETSHKIESVLEEFKIPAKVGGMM